MTQHTRAFETFTLHQKTLIYIKTLLKYLLRLCEWENFFAPFSRAFPFLKKRGRKVFCLCVFFLRRYLHVIMPFKQVITVTVFYIPSAKNSVPLRHQATRASHRNPFRMRFIKLLKQWRLHIFLSRWKIYGEKYFYQKGKERIFFLCLFTSHGGALFANVENTSARSLLREFYFFCHMCFWENTSMTSLMSQWALK